MVQSYIDKAIEEHKLYPHFSSKVEQWYVPLAKRISEKCRLNKKTFVVGIQGTQGSGKSTLADFLKLILMNEYQLNSVVVSIDDFYHTRLERQKIAKSVHPLFLTRGVPGTHDIGLALNVLDELIHLDENATTLVPTFNKATDDRSSIDNWNLVKGPIDVVIFEGWCVGVKPQNPKNLVVPVNILEAEEDPHVIWRTYVNKQLGSDYQKLFQQLDYLVVLNAPSFTCVFEWRLLQEQKLATRLAEDGHTDDSQKLLTGQQVKRFIAHYQRLTEHALNTMPSLADYVLYLDTNHNIISFSEAKQQ